MHPPYGYSVTTAAGTAATAATWLCRICLYRIKRASPEAAPPPGLRAGDLTSDHVDGGHTTWAGDNEA
jgi:hypothetical protein